jgi:hypothetical protein
MQSSFEVNGGGYRLRDGVYDDWDWGFQELSQGLIVLVCWWLHGDLFRMLYPSQGRIRMSVYMYDNT